MIMNRFRLKYAGIGSRETPKNIQELMIKIARHLEEIGFLLRSGGAVGADIAFENGVNDNDNKEIFLGNNENIPKIAFDIAEKFHPIYYSLKPYVMKLMARNSQIILGENCNDPVNYVICWTLNGKEIGGTSQGLRIAREYNIPIYNLFFKSIRDNIFKLCEEI